MTVSLFLMRLRTSVCVCFSVSCLYCNKVSICIWRFVKDFWSRIFLYELVWWRCMYNVGRLEVLTWSFFDRLFVKTVVKGYAEYGEGNMVSNKIWCCNMYLFVVSMQLCRFGWWGNQDSKIIRIQGLILWSALYLFVIGRFFWARQNIWIVQRKSYISEFLQIIIIIIKDLRNLRSF